MSTRAQDYERYLRIDAAFRTGDLAALRTALDNPDGFPNVEAHPAMGMCLVYAVYHSPVAFLGELIDAGADPNGHDHDGFPPLVAAISCNVSSPGSPAQPDVLDRVRALLSRGSDIEQRGVNDWTPLHMAAGQGDLALVDLLLVHGADANAITRIDDMETAYEIAAAAGHTAVAARLKPLTGGQDVDGLSITPRGFT